MPEVLLTFLDGEVMAAETPLIDFTRPILEVRSLEPGSNNRELIVPMSSLKYIVFGGEVEHQEDPEEAMFKVVIHFHDHEVLRGYAGRQTLGGPLGIIYTLLDPNRDVRRRVGIPYSAVKAIFKVKTWDSRVGTEPGGYGQVARILADRERHGAAGKLGISTEKAAKPRPQPMLDRARKGQPDEGAAKT